MLSVSDEDPYLGEYLLEQQKRDPVWQAKQREVEEQEKRERLAYEARREVEKTRIEAERRKQLAKDDCAIWRGALQIVLILALIAFFW